jgi:hypothetical protein
MSFRQFKDWNDTKPVKQTLVQFKTAELLKQAPRIEGCNHESGFTMWRMDSVIVRMSKQGFDDWVALRLRMKHEDKSLVTREAADLEDWVPWDKTHHLEKHMQSRMKPLESIEKGLGL